MLDVAVHRVMTLGVLALSLAVSRVAVLCVLVLGVSVLCVVALGVAVFCAAALGSVSLSVMGGAVCCSGSVLHVGRPRAQALRCQWGVRGLVGRR